jgi:hypothetical protein
MPWSWPGGLVGIPMTATGQLSEALEAIETKVEDGT